MFGLNLLGSRDLERKIGKKLVQLDLELPATLKWNQLPSGLMEDPDRVHSRQLYCGPSSKSARFTNRQKTDSVTSSSTGLAISIFFMFRKHFKRAACSFGRGWWNKPVLKPILSMNFLQLELLKWSPSCLGTHRHGEIMLGTDRYFSGCGGYGKYWLQGLKRQKKLLAIGICYKK